MAGSKNKELKNIDVSYIYANPDQPRKEFDKDKLEELAMSIKEYGILEPIVVTKRDDRYMIIAGERRYRASGLARLKTMPCMVIEADAALVEELALLENIQREDLNIMEEARAFRALLDRGWSNEELATKMGFKQVWRVEERLSLLKLAPEYQDMVISGELGHSQAFETSRLPVARQADVLRLIRSGKLNSYNSLRSFVNGLLLIDSQENLFELQTLTPSEEASIRILEATVKAAERLTGQLQNSQIKHLEKVAFHSTVSVERLDLIIQSMQKIRKAVFAGSGVKEAMKEVM